MIFSYMVCSFRYRLIWNLCFLHYIIFFSIKGVNISVICSKIRTMPWVPNMHYQWLLTLCWCWLSGYNREQIAVLVSPEGCQYLINGYLWPIRTLITYDGKLKIIDTPLTLIFRFGALIMLLCLLPIKAANPLDMYNSNQITVQLSYLQDPKLLTHHWHSIDAPLPSIWCTVYSSSAPINNYFHDDLILLVVFQIDWDINLWQS